jgi:F-type H+-transporting ATPase subunit delta
VIAGQVAARYSKALFKLAANPADLERREKDLEGVVEILRRHPKLGFLLSAPQIRAEQKKKVLENALAGRIDQKSLEFLYFLLEKGRMNHLEEISRQYRRLVKESLGVLEASLITAVPVDSVSRERLKSKLEASFRKKIEIKERIDSQILGGVILVLANQVLDWSVKDRLNSLKESLLSVQVV